MTSSHPNIVLIMCDQMRHDCAGFAGHGLVKTPNLDALAQGGVVFERAYCASPVCSPARASWLTGLYPHAHGQLRNYGASSADQPGRIMREDCVTIGDALKGAGYRCGIVGPWHLGHDHLPQHGFTDYWCTYRYQGNHPDRLSKYFDDQGVANLYAGSEAINDDIAQMRYGTITEPRQQRTTWTIDRGLEFLEAKDDRPSFLFLSIKDPHPLILVPPQLLELYPLDRIELPPSWRDPLEGKPPYQLEELSRLATDVDDHAFRRMMAHYYALITHIDQQVDRVVEALQRLKLERNTIIAFMSDHGEMLGAHGFVCKCVMYEESAKVPCILSLPGELPAGLHVRTPLGGVDLMPTLLDLAGVPLETTIDGVSVAEPIRAARQGEQRTIFAQISTWRAIKGQSDDPAELAAHVMACDGRWKYVRNRFDIDELYDLEADPLEMTNLAELSDQAQRITQMRRRIATMLRVTGPGPYAWCLSE